MTLFAPAYNYRSVYKIDPSGQKYLDNLNAYDPSQFIGTGLGAAGRWGRNIITHPGMDISQYAGPELAFIKGEAARDKEISNARTAGMLRYANQPGVAAAQIESGNRARDMDTGLQAAGAARGIRSEALQSYANALAQRRAAQQAIAQLEFAKREAANKAWEDSFKQSTGGGWLGDLLKKGAIRAGQAGAALATGGASLALPGGGAYGGFGDSAWST